MPKPRTENTDVWNIIHGIYWGVNPANPVTMVNIHCRFFMWNSPHCCSVLTQGEQRFTSSLRYQCDPRQHLRLMWDPPIEGTTLYISTVLKRDYTSPRAYTVSAPALCSVKCKPQSRIPPLPGNPLHHLNAVISCRHISLRLSPPLPPSSSSSSFRVFSSWHPQRCVTASTV